MDILVGDIENKILEIFDSSKVLSVDKENSGDKFIIYPNPTKDNLTIEFYIMILISFILKLFFILKVIN